MQLYLNWGSTLYSNSRLAAQLAPSLRWMPGLALNSCQTAIATQSLHRGLVVLSLIGATNPELWGLS